MPLILGVLGVIVAVFLISKLSNRDRSGSYNGIAVLPVSDYIENGLSYRNNEYQLQGEVTEKPASDASRGQLVFVRVESQDGSEVEEVSIKIPRNVGTVNLETKHDYSFKVKVVKGGFLEASDFQPL